MARNQAKITLLAKWKDKGAKKGLANLDASITSLAKKMLGAFAGVAILRGIKSQITAQIELADSLGKLGLAYDISARRLAGWRGALRLGGTDLGMFDQALRSLERALRQAISSAVTPGGMAFKALGVDIRDGTGALRSLDDIILDVAEGMKNYGNATERTMISQALFTTGHIKLMPVLLQGRDALNEQIEAQAKLSGITDEGAAAAARYRDQVEQLSQAWQGLLTKGINPLLGPLTELLKAFADISDDPGAAFRDATGFRFGSRIPGMGQLAFDRQRASGAGFLEMFGNPLFPGLGGGFSLLDDERATKQRAAAAAGVAAATRAASIRAAAAAEARAGRFGTANRFNIGVGFGLGGIGGPRGGGLVSPLERAFAEITAPMSEMEQARAAFLDLADATGRAVETLRELSPSLRFQQGARGGFLARLGLGDGSNIAGRLGGMAGQAAASGALALGGRIGRGAINVFTGAVDAFTGATRIQAEAAQRMQDAATSMQRVADQDLLARVQRFEGKISEAEILRVSARTQLAAIFQANPGMAGVGSPILGGGTAEEIVDFLRSEDAQGRSGLQLIAGLGDSALINTLIDLIRQVEGNTAATAENTAPDVRMLGLSPLATSGALRFAQTAQGRALILQGAIEQANLAGGLGLTPTNLGITGTDPTFIPSDTSGGEIPGVGPDGEPLRGKIAITIVVNGEVVEGVAKAVRSGAITIDVTNPKRPKISATTGGAR